MHKKKQHKTEIDTHVHGPSEKILPEHLNLQKDIEDKDLQQGKDLATEKCQYDSLECCENPC
jgi:hypothetical protein